MSSRLDGLVLKIFPPMLRAQFISERTSLSQLRGRVSIPIPEIVHQGERDGWPYLVITRLRGMLGAEVWATLPEDQKERVLGQIGATIAEVQRVPIGELSGIEPRWEPFMQKQIEGCGARHRRLGLPQKYWKGLDEIVRDAATLIPMDASPVILTGEYIPENFLLSREGGDWRLSGLIDFGDVLTGWGEYDLLGPSAFMTAGHAGPGPKSFQGIRILAGGRDAGHEAAADGADAAASRQRSDPAHLYRGLAGEGRRSVRTGGIALAGLRGRPYRQINCINK